MSTKESPWCDVAVVGAGPAGTVAALRLAQRGFNVVQLVGRPEGRERPPEILGPLARLLLQRLQLFEAADLGDRCAGVLKRWGTENPDFIDYNLTHVLDGRSVGREQLRTKLIDKARLAGVSHLHARAIDASREGTLTWRSADGRRGQIRAQWILIAGGRSWSASLSGGFSRARIDSLVALAVERVLGANQDTLVLEASDQGWWYAPPAGQAKAWLVFVTDGDLLAREPAQRRAVLEGAYKRSLLVADLGGQCDFSRASGLDAHSGAVHDPVIGRVVAIGDAAISSDPLSGSGIQHAMEGAWVAADELADAGSVGGGYRRWFEAFRTHQAQQRRYMYTEAGRLFPQSAFWRRRIAVERASRIEPS